MSEYPGNRSKLRELAGKIGNLLESVEKDKVEAKCEGRVKGVGGIRGVHMDYHFSVESLTDRAPYARPCGKNRKDGN